jgi:hypothetical protein
MRRDLAGDLFLIVVIVACAVILGVATARAHGWYDYSCCSERDCAAAVSKDAVVETREGYRVTLRAGSHPSFPPGAATRVYFVPHGDPRIKNSRDEDFHPCVPPATMNLICLYRPPGGA